MMPEPCRNHVWEACRVYIRGRCMFIDGCMFCGEIESIKPAVSYIGEQIWAVSADGTRRRI